MRINNVLDEVFSKASNIAVLRVLRNYTDGLSGREVSRQSNLSSRAALKALTDLESLGLVNCHRGGREHSFNLNRKNYIVQKVILPALATEADFLEVILYKVKHALAGVSLSAYLFGSVARKEDSVESDIDICIVYENDRLDAVEDAVAELNSRLFVEFGAGLSPFYITAAEFRKRAEAKKSPVEAIIKEGKLIFGNTIHRTISGKTLSKDSRRQSSERKL